MKICLVSPSPPPYGGIANWTNMICNHFDTNPQVQIIKVDTAPRWRKIHNTSSFYRIIGGGFQLINDLFKFIITIKKNDVCHLTSSGQFSVIRDLIIVSICRIVKKPVIYHLHFGRIPEIQKGGTLEWKLIKIVIPKCSAVIVLDQVSLKLLNDLFPQISIVQIPNPVDIKSLPEKNITIKKTVVFIGWNIPTKGLCELVESWHLCNTQNWELLIIGPGDNAYRSVLLNEFQSTTIKFLGELSHDKAMDVLAESSFLVLPSYTEGFPFVVIEAMALGKAVIATSVGAIPEMVDESCGIVIKPKDVNALKLSLDLLLNNPDLSSKMGKSAKKKCITEYDINIVCKKLYELWESV